MNSTSGEDDVSPWLNGTSNDDWWSINGSSLLPRLLPVITDHLSSSSSSSSWDWCDKFRVMFNTVAIGLLCVVGLAGNVLSVAVLQRDRHNRVAVFLLKALSVTDSAVLLVSCVVLSIFYGLLPQVDLDAVRRFRPYFVKFVNPLGSMAQMCTVWMTVLLGVNRYIAVCRPFTSGRTLTLSGARIQVLTVVVLSIALNVPRVFQYDIVHDVTSSNTSSSSYPSSRLSSLGRHVVFEVIYSNALYTSVVLILPLVLLVAVNAKVVHQLQMSKRSMQNNSLHYVGRHENSITTVMVIIILILVVCHTPDRVVQVFKFFTAVNHSHRCPQPLYFAANVGNFLIVFNSSINFVVYYVFRKRFRVILRSKLCRWLRPGRDSMIDRKMSNDPMNPLLINFRQIS